MDIDFIIPAYNEENNIGDIISEIREWFQNRIIVIDDGSSDGTYEAVPRGKNIVVLRNEKNMGKGYSVKKALDFVEGEYICLLDGDVKGIVEEIRASEETVKNYDCIVFTPPIRSGGFGLVRSFSRYGVRKRTGIDCPWCISGMRIVKTDVMRKMSGSLDDRFGFEVSMTIQLFTGNYRVKNISINFMHRITGGDLRGFIHRGRQFYDIMKYYISSRK